MLDGKITKVRKLRTQVPTIEYLKQQKRFQHLAAQNACHASLRAIQEQADRNVEKYKLMA
jgi:pyruvate/2-oxoacid:ferredoxin oxidoreductase beta subunit